MALASRAADDETFHAVFNLVLDVSVESSQVNLAVLSVRRLDCSYELRLLNALQVLHLLVSWLGNGDRIEH